MRYVIAAVLVYSTLSILVTSACDSGSDTCKNTSDLFVNKSGWCSATFDCDEDGVNDVDVAVGSGLSQPGTTLYVCIWANHKYPGQGDVKRNWEVSGEAPCDMPTLKAAVHDERCIHE